MDKISNNYLPVSRTSGNNKLYSIPTTRSPAMSPLCRRHQRSSSSVPYALDNKQEI